MTIKITGLSALNVQALRETMPGVSVTATTATFHQPVEDALIAVETVIDCLPGRAHPKASLHAVVRKLRRLLLNAPQPVPVEPTLAQKVIASVNTWGQAYSAMVHGEDGIDIDVEFPTMYQAADFVRTYGLDGFACVRADGGGMFNTPVVITFTLEDYARTIGIN
jgi:hypothetical protein